MESHYRTQSLYEASFLMARGFPLAGKEKTGSKITLLFKDGKEIREEALEFYNGTEVEAKAVFDAYRSLKDYVFEK